MLLISYSVLYNLIMSASTPAAFHRTGLHDSCCRRVIIRKQSEFTLKNLPVNIKAVYNMAKACQRSHVPILAAIAIFRVGSYMVIFESANTYELWSCNQDALLFMSAAGVMKVDPCTAHISTSISEPFQYLYISPFLTQAPLNHKYRLWLLNNQQISEYGWFCDDFLHTIWFWACAKYIWAEVCRRNR